MPVRNTVTTGYRTSAAGAEVQPAYHYATVSLMLDTLVNQYFSLAEMINSSVTDMIKSNKFWLHQL